MKKGFTLTEILISLMVIAIITAVSVPVITQTMTRQRAALNRAWKWGNNNAAYFDSTNNSVLLIGGGGYLQNNVVRVVIHANSNNIDHLGFYNNDVKAGSLKVNNDGVFFGSNIYFQNEDDSNSVAIGRGINIGSNSVVIGNGSYTHNNGVTIGYASGGGNDAVSIGESTDVYGNSIGIGKDAHARANNAIAIGPDTTVSGNYSAILGRNSVVSGIGTMIIGEDSNVAVSNSIVIGHGTTLLAESTYTYLPGQSNSYSGHVVLGSPSMKVILNGNTYSPATMYINSINASTLTASNTPQSSDLRLKNINNEYILGFDKLNKLKIYNYTFKNDPSKQRVGVIAQQLMKIFPDAVSKDETGYYLIRQEDIFYTMVNALKEFDIKIKDIIKQVTDLNKVVVSVDLKIKKLSKQAEKNANDIEKLKKEINSIEVKLRNNS